MRRILILTNALEVKPGLLDFACFIARQERSKLTGVFVERHQLDTNTSVKSVGGQMYVEEITRTNEEKIKHDAEIAAHVSLFQDGCLQREVTGTVHYYSENVLKSVIHETRYADLIIVDPATSLLNDDSVPSEFVVSILKNAECPVIIAPEDAEQINDIVFAFDGSKSSVFAIKQFCNFLPQFRKRHITVLHIGRDGAAADHATERALLNEWLAIHFSEIDFVELSGDPGEELFKYFMTKEDRNSKLLVSGAYGRSMLSQILKPSTTSLILKVLDMPVFITHF